MIHATRATRLVILCAALTACRGTPPQLAPSVAPAAAEWQAVLPQATQEVSAGRYAAADKLLAEFGARNPSTEAATESMFWRALFKLDPANPAPAIHEASMLLDSYLQAQHGGHRHEATVLRRVSSALEARTVALTPGGGAPRGL